MKSHLLPAFALGLAIFSSPDALIAQSTPAPAAPPVTRAQVKMERDEWIKTHHWNQETDQWILNRGVEPPVGIKSRSEVKAQRDTFLSNNRWNETKGEWIPVQGIPRTTSTMTRKQVRDDTKRFISTHHFDEIAGQWIDNPVKTKRQ